MRIGIGYDVHEMIEGEGLYLGGVFIPCNYGLVAHSDGDVLLHAIIDAILGAAAIGDIGELFPDNDNTYKDISSLSLLEQANHLLLSNNYEIENIDSIIIAQEPKLSPYKKEMVSTIANCLNLSPDKVSVKATTEEHLGFTGDLKGIKAQAVCLIKSL